MTGNTSLKWGNALFVLWYASFLKDRWILSILTAILMFSVWQMGVIFYSGRTLSFYGRTPLPLTLGNMSLHIAVGYILSIVFIYFFPRFVVLAGRFLTGMSLMSAMALYLPLPENILLAVFIFHCYCCVFMIGIENTLITYLFKEETATRFLTLALPACAVISFGSIVGWLIPLFTLILAKLYPARFISPVAIGLALISVMIHAALLEALRDNIQFLYIVYIVIAVGLSMLYLVLEPHLAFTLREKAAAGTEENADGHSADTSTNTPAESGSIEQRQGGKSIAGVLQNRTFDKLTGQELRVSELILRGYSYTEIAKTLKLKPSTIKSYQKNIYAKLQINSKRELFAITEKAPSWK